MTRFKIVNLIKNDLRIAIISQWKKFIPIILIALAGCIYLSISSKGLIAAPAFMDYLIYFNKGIEPFTRFDPNAVFNIPGIWLCLHLYIFYLIADYPISDLRLLGKEILVRIENRRLWWISKCITTVFTVFLCYFLLFITIYIFTLLTRGHLSLQPSDILFKNIFGYSYLQIKTIDFLVTVILLPFVITVSASLFQLSISLLSRSILSFLFIVIILVASTYYLNPLLIGNYLMLLRNNLFLINGVLTNQGFLLSGLFGITGYLIGHITIKEMNIY